MPARLRPGLGFAAACVAATAGWLLPRAGLPPAALAHEAITTQLTWTRDVSRIVHNRCAGCHRQGGAAPMPLTTYQEARPWAAAIRHQVLSRRMPPWGAVKGFGAFRNDASLSLPEVAVLSSWVQGGAPEGDPAFLEPFHHHGGRPAASGPSDARLLVKDELRLGSDLLATGVSSGPRPAGAWAQLTAHLPDGSVEHLIWIRAAGSLPETDYWFLRPVPLPAGTRLLCRPSSARLNLRHRAQP